MLKSTLCSAVVSDLVSWGFGHSKCFGVSQSNERNNGYPRDRVEEQEGESFLLITVWLTITRAIMILGRRKDGSMFHIERIRRLREIGYSECRVRRGDKVSGLYYFFLYVSVSLEVRIWPHNCSKPHTTRFVHYYTMMQIQLLTHGLFQDFLHHTIIFLDNGT